MNSTPFPSIRAAAVLLGLAGLSYGFGLPSVADGSQGPLGEWPDFVPLGNITAPHPDNPSVQTHLYGDWGGIVGEEFIFLQDGKVKLLYHCWTNPVLSQGHIYVRSTCGELACLDVRNRPGAEE